MDFPAGLCGPCTRDVARLSESVAKHAATDTTITENPA